MAKEAKIEAARSELTRLLQGLEFFRTWQISSLKRSKGEVTQDDLNQIVMPSAFFFQVFDETTGNGRSAVIRDVQEWYSQAANDLIYTLKFGDDATQADTRNFLLGFRKEVGFDFFAEAGLLKKTANRTLRSSKIANQGDYYLLKELEDDSSQSLLNDKDLATISALLRDFEDRDS